MRHTRASEIFRRERLLWVTSNRHSTHEEPLPLALGRPTAAGAAPRSNAWRRSAGRTTSLYTSANASAVGRRAGRPRGFGLPGIGVAARHARAQPGRRLSRPASCRIGLIRNPHERLPLADALAEHIISCLDNLSEAATRRSARDQDCKNCRRTRGSVDAQELSASSTNGR